MRAAESCDEVGGTSTPQSRADSKNAKKDDNELTKVPKQGGKKVDTPVPSTSRILSDGTHVHVPKFFTPHKEDMPSPAARQTPAKVPPRLCIAFKASPRWFQSISDDEPTMFSPMQPKGQAKCPSIRDQSNDSVCASSGAVSRVMNFNAENAMPMLTVESSSGTSTATHTEVTAEPVGGCETVSCFDARLRRKSGRFMKRQKPSDNSKKNVNRNRSAPSAKRIKALKATEDDNLCDICCTGGEEILMCCGQFKCRKVFHVKCCQRVPINADNAAPKSISTLCIWCASKKEAMEVEEIFEQIHKLEGRWYEFAKNKKGIITRPHELQLASHFMSEIYKLDDGIRVRFIAERLRKSGTCGVLDFRDIWMRLFGNCPSRTSFLNVTDLLDSLKLTLNWYSCLFTRATESERMFLQKFRAAVEELQRDFYS